MPSLLGSRALLPEQRDPGTQDRDGGSEFQELSQVVLE